MKIFNCRKHHGFCTRRREAQIFVKISRPLIVVVNRQADKSGIPQVSGRFSGRAEQSGTEAAPAFGAANPEVRDIDTSSSADRGEYGREKHDAGNTVDCVRDARPTQLRYAKKRALQNVDLCAMRIAKVPRQACKRGIERRDITFFRRSYEKTLHGSDRRPIRPFEAEHGAGFGRG